MRAEINTQLMVDVYHESRPGYERLLEPVEANYKPNHGLDWFEVNMIYTSYNLRSREQHTSPGFEEDDFEHTERLPKEKLMIETKNGFNVNISNETVKVANHLIAAFAESVTDMEKTSSLTNAVGKKSTAGSDVSKHSDDIRAPITIENQTGHDIVLIAPSHWAWTSCTGRLVADAVAVRAGMGDVFWMHVSKAWHFTGRSEQHAAQRGHARDL